MHYEVTFVEDAALPSGVDYAFVRLADRTYLFMKESAVACAEHRAAALTRSFNTWERAQSVELKQFAGSL